MEQKNLKSNHKWLSYKKIIRPNEQKIFNSKILHLVSNTQHTSTTCTGKKEIGL